MPPAAQRGGGSRKPQRFPQGTKWAYFTNIPKGLPNSKKGGSGWVRVGSKLWGQIHFYNTHGHHEGGARGGTVMNNPVHPVRYVKAHYNPGSSAYKGNGPKSDGQQMATQGDKITPSQRKRGMTQTTYKNKTPKVPGQGGGNNRNQQKRNQNVRRANGVTLSKQMGNPAVGKMLSQSDANAQAGLQFDAQIHDTQAQLADQGAQGAQDLRDIADWFGAAKQSNAAAQAANQHQVTASAAAQDAATRQVLAAIGGSANAGAGMVGAAGDTQSGILRMLGTIQDQYQNNLNPALDQASAAASAAQQALNSQQQQALQTQLSDLLGQRGQAQVADMNAITQANNALAQTRFGNRISKLQAMMGAQQMAGNQRIQRQQLLQAKQQTKAGGAGSKNRGGITPWVKLNADQRYNQALQLMQGVGGKQVGLNVALGRATALGYDAALVRPYLKSFYQ